MEPDVIRMYSSSPPPMDDGGEEEESEFGDFGTFSGVPPSISFTEFDTPTTFNQTQALTATSPPELLSSRGTVGFGAPNGHRTSSDLSRANGVGPVKCPGSGPSERTETKKARSTSPDVCASDVAAEPPNCNGGCSAEVLTNGFATFDVRGSPPLQNTVQSRFKGTPPEAPVPACSPEDDFADFSAFSNAEGCHSHTANQDAENPVDEHHIERGATSEDAVRGANRTGPNQSESNSTPVPAEARDPRSDAGSPQRDAAFTQEHFASQADCTNEPASLNGVGVADGDDSKDNDLSPDGSGETSLGRALSTDALEEYGDASTTGSAPSPSLHGETASPADLSQPAEDEEDFGRFGDAGQSSCQAVADFDCPVVRCSPAQENTESKDRDDFGNFNSPKFQSGGDESQDGEEFADFPPSGSFGNFSSAFDTADGEADAGWSAFGEQEVEEESWAAFSTEAAPPAASREEEEEEEEEEEWHESGPPAVSEETSRTDRLPVALSSRLERLFQSSFPQAPVLTVADEVTTLKMVLGPPEDQPQPGAEEKTSPCRRSAGGSVWTQLQDINEAVGLRYQWGGSHCNKTLLCCLGIDTRNILFTGQKKQPVIVPMYAASLGMLEPTKEPVKPVSAAEMIASIGQAPPAAPASKSGPSDSVQEALPPVQFDWSSSGLTNPLDASGGSSLLNLDFFGPVEDSGSTSSASIPGVDPELFELTTAKMDSGGSGSRVADAFARLMSTMEKTSTSTRKPRKEENLSAEAAGVIAGLPDLSFMQAKVLMFPATLTPIGSQATPD